MRGSALPAKHGESVVDLSTDGSFEQPDDRELDERFRSIQERFDATYVDTPTEFRYRGFATPEEDATFRSDLVAAAAELAEKCPEGYSLELPTALVE